MKTNTPRMVYIYGVRAIPVGRPLVEHSVYGDLVAALGTHLRKLNPRPALIEMGGVRFEWEQRGEDFIFKATAR